MMTTNVILEQEASCHGLVYSAFQRPILQNAQQGFTAALVAAHPGAGTTYLTKMLAGVLERDASRPVLPLNGRQMFDLGSRTDKRSADLSLSESSVELSWPVSHGTWRGRPDYRIAFLKQLRDRFQYVLVDCPSLKESTDVLGIAPYVDGVFLVVEANRTRKQQLQYLERSIASAGGQIFGHLLNKRNYPIPAWLYRKIESVGN